LSSSYDVVVVGAGIVGLANAYTAAKRGKRVLVCERDPKACSASVRNFGMVWPVGQPAGLLREIAVESRNIWLELLQDAGFWYRECGSLHLAYEPDELTVLEEFCEKGPGCGYQVSMLSHSETLGKSAVVREKCLLGSMWSPQELCVDPRQVVGELPAYLREKFGVEFRFSTAVLGVESGRVVTPAGDIEATEIFLCNGADFETIRPSLYKGMVRCKLQMLRVRPRVGFSMGTHLCAGLTLAHYGNFVLCSSLAAYKARIAREMPEYVKWGIHVLVSQHTNGDLTIGDSHEYGNAVSPFNREEIDDLILGYCNRFLPVDEFEIVERWHGVYAKGLEKPFVWEEVAAGVTAVIGVGGAGMTLSFGLAAHVQRA